MAQGKVTGFLIKGKIIDGTGSPAIDDGAVVVLGERIAWVGRAADLPAEHCRSRLDRVIKAGCLVDFDSEIPDREI